MNGIEIRPANGEYFVFYCGGRIGKRRTPEAAYALAWDVWERNH